MSRAAPSASGPCGARRRPGRSPPATFDGSPGPPGRAVHPLRIKFLRTRTFSGSSRRWRPRPVRALLGHIHPVDGSKTMADGAHLAVVHSFQVGPWAYEVLRNRVRSLMGLPEACRRLCKTRRGTNRGEWEKSGIGARSVSVQPVWSVRSCRYTRFVPDARPCQPDSTPSPDARLVKSCF